MGNIISFNFVNNVIFSIFYLLSCQCTTDTTQQTTAPSYIRT